VIPVVECSLPGRGTTRILPRRRLDLPHEAGLGGGPSTALAAKQVTSIIPVVFVIGTDPVVDGLIASPARPGGNVTDVSMTLVELTPKRLELVPAAKVMALLVNPKNANAERSASPCRHRSSPVPTRSSSE
jgi:hypothetical protein